MTRLFKQLRLASNWFAGWYITLKIKFYRTLANWTDDDFWESEK